MKNSLENNIYAICYDNLYVFNSKEEAKKHFGFCFNISEGAEHERYASILADLNFTNVCKDNISKYCTEMSIKVNDKDEYLKLTLDKNLSIDESINYYENFIKPIIEVSKEYDVDFNSKIPFESFESDEESYTNISFSKYYKEVLEKLNVEVDNIYTDSWSDGKYDLVVNEKSHKLTAWDNLDSVIDNVNSIINCLQKEEGMEM